MRALEGGLQLVQPLLLERRVGKAGFEAVGRQLVGGGAVQPGGGKHGLEIGVDVAAKVGRVVAVDGGAQAAGQQPRQAVARQVGEHLEFLVGQRADGERDALLRQPLHQRRVVHGLHAVVDALGAQDVQRAPDVGGRAFLAGVGDDVQAQLAAAREHAGEFFGRVTQLAGVEPHADEGVAPGQGGFQRLEGLALGQVPQKAQDQRAADAQIAARVVAGAGEAAHHRVQGHAARRVRLRVEENLGAHYVFRSCPRKIGARQVVKILFLQQHAGALVVQVQERLQAAEGVGPAQALDVGIGQGDAVAARQREAHLGLQRAFDVDVQLGLGQGGQQGRQVLGGHRWRRAAHGMTPKVMPLSFR